ncbi:MAG TPA: hypothetical protein VFJ72_07120 [Rubrobacteraceae bacterium]|nr:hypothetical protein [Rubrobacteraceae bacterium]
MRERDEIDFGRLVDWIEGDLAPEEAAEVEERVARADEETRADAEWLRAFRSVSEATVLVSPPPEVHDALVGRFEAYAEDRREPGLHRRLLATLSFDSSLQPAFGVRSAGTRESHRQLIFATYAADVALDTFYRSRDNRVDLEGQVFPAGEDPEHHTFAVQLLEGESDRGTTATDDLGAFSFRAIQPGAYDLLLDDGEVEIRLAQVDLRT